jgi:hypothetical protein
MALAITVPAVLEMLVGEQLNCTINFTQLIAPGDVISSPTVTITNTDTNETVPSAIIGSPGVSGNAIMTLTVNSSNLRKKNTYIATLSVTATGGGQAKQVGALLTIVIVY